jgi:uncharacterized protein (DUF736 family)
MEYYNTNKGVAYKPFPEQNLILSGKLDVDGTQEQVAIISAESKDGKKRLEVFMKVGVLFPNEKKAEQKEGAPDYGGPIQLDGEEKRLAAWKREKDGNKYMSMDISEPRPKTEDEPQTTQQLTDNKVPF